MLRTKVVFSITCINGDQPLRRSNLGHFLKGYLYQMDRTNRIFNGLEDGDVADIATAVYVEEDDEIDQLLYDILTGDGQQTENLDAEFMKESITEMVGDNDEDVPFTITRDTLFRLIKAVNDRSSKR